jgi:hypothetical protein
MHEPSFKPETWITYQQETNGGFGKIIGGHYDGTSWHYTVQGASAGGELQTVHENTITFSLQNGSWMAPTHLTGQGSIYTDTTPSL